MKSARRASTGRAGNFTLPTFSPTFGWGLVDAVATPEGLDAEVERFAAAILAGGKEALRLQKGLIADWQDLSTSAAIARGIDVFAEAYDTDEPHRMARARLAEMRSRRGEG